VDEPVRTVAAVELEATLEELEEEDVEEEEEPFLALSGYAISMHVSTIEMSLSNPPSTVRISRIRGEVEVR